MPNNKRCIRNIPPCREHHIGEIMNPTSERPKSSDFALFMQSPTVSFTSTSNVGRGVQYFPRRINDFSYLSPVSAQFGKDDVRYTITSRLTTWCALCCGVGSDTRARTCDEESFQLYCRRKCVSRGSKEEHAEWDSTVGQKWSDKALRASPWYILSACQEGYRNVLTICSAGTTRQTQIEQEPAW